MSANQIRWVPDSEAPNCTSCGIAFSFSRRRHHCRLCGQVVCQSCSPSKVRIGRESIRACDDCFVSYDPAGNTRDFEPVGTASRSASAQPSGINNPYETFLKPDDATQSNATRRAYVSPLLAEEPKKCCCVIC